MTAFDAEHVNEIGLDLPTTEAATPHGNPDRYEAVNLAVQAVADEPIGHRAADILGLANRRVESTADVIIDPASALEQARTALQAGAITAPEFIERVAPLLGEIRPTPTEEPTPAPGLVALGQSLAPIVRAGSGLGVVGLGLGVVALAGGAFALGVLARPAATR